MLDIPMQHVLYMYVQMGVPFFNSDSMGIFFLQPLLKSLAIPVAQFKNDFFKYSGVTYQKKCIETLDSLTDFLS